MQKKILTFAILTSLFLTSCKETPKQESTEETTETVATTTDEIVTSTSTDKDGKKLEMSFNNTKDVATLNFNGETIELIGQKPASGIWYKNDHYELQGKENDVELTKDGKVIFSHKDEIETSSAKNKEGQTLEMSFNNTTNEASVVFNGETIEMKGQNPASGIWYKNDNYELSGKGENVELKKDGKTVFKK
jgi:membrane-bound inhibitor of C-type lysozyme